MDGRLRIFDDQLPGTEYREVVSDSQGPRLSFLSCEKDTAAAEGFIWFEDWRYGLTNFFIQLDNGGNIGGTI